MHHWQDLVLALSALFFNISLIPSIRGKDKPALATSLITTLFLSAVLAVYISLGLWYASAMATVNLVLWATLAVQKWHRPVKRRR